MKKLKPLDQIKPEDSAKENSAAEEFENLVAGTIFKKLTPEERERIDSQLPKSLRKGYKKRSDDKD